MAFRVFCETLITDGQRYSHVILQIEKGRIVGWERYTPEMQDVLPPDVDARGKIVTPGMIDLHIHGGGGRDLMEGTVDAVQSVAKHLLQYGVTGFLVTPLTAPWDAIRATIASASEVRRYGSEGAQVLGCHLEGPFINPKRAGAQPPEYIVPPRLETLEQALGNLMKELRIITIAPELEGSEPVIRALVGAGVIVSIGHTDADYDTVSRAVDWGARHATHCFNAMRPLHHREPGTVGAVLSHPELKAELIWDHVHTHPAVAQVLVKAKGTGGVLCVSDGVAGAGMPEGSVFELWGHRAVVSEGKATLVENGSLAGSVIGMDTCWRHAVHAFNAEVASMLCASNPARALGLEGRKGTLCQGADADFVIWNPTNWQIESTWVAGICKYLTN